MAQRLDRPVRWIVIAAAVVIAAAFVSLTYIAGTALNELGAQRQERDCRFDLTTETDKLDSLILVKQAQIFEAAILRPSPGEGSTEELQRLANQLHALIEDQTVAYEQRDNAESRCD